MKFIITYKSSPTPRSDVVEADKIKYDSGVIMLIRDDAGVIAAVNADAIVSVVESKSVIQGEVTK